MLRVGEGVLFLNSYPLTAYCRSFTKYLGVKMRSFSIVFAVFSADLIL